MSKVKFYLLYPFINKLLTYANEIQVMQDLARSTANAAGKAIEKATHTEQKIKMNVLISNPLIIIPVNPNSDDFLSIDLGQISLQNEFIEVQTKWLGLKLNIPGSNGKACLFNYRPQCNFTFENEPQDDQKYKPSSLSS
jgi:hypothetical protein